MLSDIPELTAGAVLARVTEHYKAEFPVDWENPDAYDRNMRNQETHQRLEELVSKFGHLFEIDQFLDRKVCELSGGERTKLSLLMLLGSEPDVLLLDEPTNHLDLESIAKLIGLFDTYKRIGAGVVCVSHVEWFLDMVGQDGTIELQVSDTARTLIHSNSPYKKYKKREQSPAVIRGRIGWKVDYGFPHRGSMLFQPEERVTIPDSPVQETEPPSISGGAITVFSGKNGTGKSKMMAEMADRSSAIFTREKGVQIAFLPQLWPERVAKGTVEQFFQWIKEQTNPLSDVSVSRFMKEVRDLGFRSTSNDMLKRKLASFSGGEQRLLWFVAASIFQGTDALFLDEPTNHMDHQTMLAIVRAIRDFPGAVVLSTHDLRLMEELEKDTGTSRSGVGTTNIVFTRDGDRTRAAQVDQSPVAYAKSTIAQSRKSGGRMQV
ncbi:ABC-F family ATP-binding cassette domain-containing protein [Candidatus Uhrbacteria bacterium]|nr:ABC-F family ATP-binding cassette domain-containing protein [Candidatus Uhrbacteria bacterium]